MSLTLPYSGLLLIFVYVPQYIIRVYVILDKELYWKLRAGGEGGRSASHNMQTSERDGKFT